MSQDLEKNQKLSHFTVEKALHSILWIDSEGHIHRTNEMARKKYGYTQKEFKGLTIFNLQPDLEKEAFERHWQSAKYHTTYFYETTHYKKNNTSFPAEIFPNIIEFEGIEYSVYFIRDLSQVKKSEYILRTISEGTASFTGDAFFNYLVQRVSEALQVDFVLIGVQSGTDEVHTLAVVDGGATIKNFSFSAVLKPCQNVLQGREVYFPAGLDLDYPDETPWKSYFGVPILDYHGVITGLIEVKNKGSMKCGPRDLDILKIFAARAGAEIERLQYIKEIENLKNKLHAENQYLQNEIKLDHNFEEIITQSDIYRKVLSQVEQVATTDATVLILGETGTGKELLARAIHSISHRKDRPLVKINCAALPPSLIESELFGHEKGAFTGAITRKEGRFELADKGTLFLDEIGELPIDLQTKLLRVLQDGEFERLGATASLKVDVRLLAATNSNLKQAIDEGRFRADLYYRLNVFPIVNPPLRDRKEDIPLLIHHFVKKFSAKTGKKIDRVPKHLIFKMQHYEWPGNIRELENIIERAVIISTGNTLSMGDWLPTKSRSSHSSGRKSLHEVEKEYILEILDLTSWKVSGPGGAAEVLAMKPTTLESRMKKLGISRRTYPS